MGSDSLKKRYIFKLISNISGFFINLVVTGLVPRALGVKNYGDFNFSTNFITQIINLLDCRSSTCFYTKLSQRQNENSLIAFYSYVAIIIFSATSLIVFIITLLPIKDFILPGQSASIIIYSLFYVIITWVLDLFVKIMDARGATVSLEKMRIINKIIGAVLLVLLYVTNQLNLNVYFYYNFLIGILLIIALYRFIKKSDFKLSLDRKIDKKSLSEYKKEFYTYSAPLGIYVLLSFVVVSFDRWVLQIYGGSYQQGLYSFSFMLTNFCFLFVTALIPLFTRELSVAAGENNIEKMGNLYRQYVPMLYAITAYFCCFIFVESIPIIKIFGGKEYLSASLVMKLLALYPLALVYSNLNGSVIYANARTKIFLKVALISTPLSILISFILINSGKFGFNLGASGLALKAISFEVIVNIIILNINTRFLKINFWKYLFHMFFSILPFIIIAFASHIIIHWFFGMFDFYSNVIGIFIISGILYTFFSLLIIWFFPLVFGLYKRDVIIQINIIRDKLFTT